VTRPLTDREAWKALQRHHATIADVHLRDLFADDPGRGERLTAEAAGALPRLLEEPVTDETLRLLVELAEERGPARAHRRDVPRRADQRHRGPRRAARRAARPRGASLVVDGEDVVPEVHEVLDRMARLRRPRPQRRVEGPHRQAIRNVVNIGIGGSDLGPVMAYEALRTTATAT
jgi:glucose-6-phosphate isomerase